MHGTTNRRRIISPSLVLCSYCIAVIMSNQPFYEVMKWYDILVNIVKVLRFTVLVGRMPHAPLVQTVKAKQYQVTKAITSAV